MFDGIWSFRYVDGRWIDEGPVPGVSAEVRTLFENPDGSLWAGTSGTGMLRVTFASPPVAGQSRPALTVEAFGTAHGLPEGGASVHDVAGAPLFFVGADAPYTARFDAGTKTFVRDETFGALEVDPLQTTFGATTDRKGRVYLDFGRGTVVAQKTPAGTWALDRAPFARFGPGTLTLYPEPDGVVWLGRADNRFVRYDTSRASAGAPVTFSPLIRRVTVNNDRLIFGGGAAEAGPPQLDAASNALRIEFAAPGYVDESVTTYQSQLDGLESDWSAWTKEARRDFTNLGFGDYRFRVRARGVSAAVSPKRSTRSRSCRPGTAPGSPTAATSRCWPASSSSWTGCSGVAWWARSASARGSRKQSCAPRPPRRWRARKAKARRTSSCSARSAARSPRRSTSTRSSASSTSA